MSDADKKIGKVWLAGAGPGDLGLLTVKTRELMNDVDVVFYDALVSAEVICQIPNDIKIVSVGKRAGAHSVPQREINRLLLDEALAGNRVLRLKGGDPFVFGRGGEELELLAENGIPFEVIPGVSSPVAVPAYAGIPVTHREITSSLHILTGHPRKGGEIRTDYESLVKSGGTLVFLMAVTSLYEICNELMRAGMNENMPVAIIQNGSLAVQKKMMTTLKNAFADAIDSGISTPAVTVIGDVCSLAASLHWAEDRALGNVQILIACSRNSNTKLAAKLRDLGAQVIELPVIDTKALNSCEDFKDMLTDSELDSPDSNEMEKWLVFTSPAGVKIFFEMISEQQIDMRQILGSSCATKFAVVGRSTSAELRKHGFSADFIPEKYNGEELSIRLSQKAHPCSRILIMRAKDGADGLIEPLRENGFDVKDIPIYETVNEIHEQTGKKIKALFEGRYIHAAAFTSGSAVRSFVRTMGDMDYSNIQAICIGERTREEAAKSGMKTFTADEASTDSMVELIVKKYGIQKGFTG